MKKQSPLLFIIIGYVLIMCIYLPYSAYNVGLENYDYALQLIQKCDGSDAEIWF